MMSDSVPFGQGTEYSLLLSNEEAPASAAMTHISNVRFRPTSDAGISIAR